MHNEVGVGEASKGKDHPFSVSNVTGKGGNQAKDVPASEGGRNRPKALWGIEKEGKSITSSDQE